MLCNSMSASPVVVVSVEELAVAVEVAGTGAVAVFETPGGAVVGRYLLKSISISSVGILVTAACGLSRDAVESEPRRERGGGAWYSTFEFRWNSPL